MNVTWLNKNSIFFLKMNFEDNFFLLQFFFKKYLPIYYRKKCLDSLLIGVKLLVLLLVYSPLY